MISNWQLTYNQLHLFNHRILTYDGQVRSIHMTFNFKLITINLYNIYHLRPLKETYNMKVYIEDIPEFFCKTICY